MDEEKEPISPLPHHGLLEGATTGRQLFVNGNVFSVYLSSDDVKENIEFLTEKALYILAKLKEGDK